MNESNVSEEPQDFLRVSQQAGAHLLKVIGFGMCLFFLENVSIGIGPVPEEDID